MPRSPNTRYLSPTPTHQSQSACGSPKSTKSAHQREKPSGNRDNDRDAKMAAQRLAQAVQGPPHLVLYGFHGDAKDRRDLRVGEAVHPVEHEDLAAPLRQRSHRRVKIAQQLVVFQAGCRRCRGWLMRMKTEPAPFGPPLPSAREHPVANSAHEIGRGIVEIDSLAMSPHTEQYFLHDVLGIRSMLEHHVGELGEPWVFATDERVEALVQVARLRRDVPRMVNARRH